MSRSRRTAAASLVLAVVLAVVSASAAAAAVAAAVGDGDGAAAGFEYRAATPLVFDGPAEHAGLAGQARFAEQRLHWTRPKRLDAQPVVPVNESEPLMPPNDEMAANRECPPPSCPTNGTCPHPGGHCCSGAKHCCEKGWSCVRTDPPTCVKEKSLLVWAECVGRACKNGYKCPFSGVDECCMGGNLCCRRGYRCFGWDDLTMTCAKMSKSEVAEMKYEERASKVEEEKKEEAARLDPGIGVPIG